MDDLYHLAFFHPTVFSTFITFIGIISPYKAQITELRKALKKDLPPQMSTHIEVNTVDGFQGRERDVIIFSCVRTHGIGFLSDERRLNVAITRARYACILVGNTTCLRKNATWMALIQHMNERKLVQVQPDNPKLAR